MPYIDIKLSCALTADKEKALKSQFGELIECIPGKTESYLMIQFQDNCRLWFRGENSEPIAFVNVMLLGKSSADAYKALADGAIKLLCHEIDVPSQNIYVKFEEVPNWFWE